MVAEAVAALAVVGRPAKAKREKKKHKKSGKPKTKAQLARKPLARKPVVSRQRKKHGEKVVAATARQTPAYTQPRPSEMAP